MPVDDFDKFSKEGMIDVDGSSADSLLEPLVQPKRRLSSRRRLEDMLEAKRLKADLAELDELSDSDQSDYDELIDELYRSSDD